MEIAFEDFKPAALKPQAKSSETLALLCAEGRRLSPAARAMDLAGLIFEGKFTGKKGQCITLVTPQGRVVLIGIGKEKDFGALTAENIGGKLVAHVNAAGFSSLRVVVDHLAGVKLSAAELAARMAIGATLRSYRFDKYRTKEKDEDKPTLTKITFAVSGARTAQKLFDEQKAMLESVFFVRDIVSEPANVIHPESLAAECKKLAKLGLDVEVLGETQMKKLGMNALLGVGQGSEKESQLVTMYWEGDPKAKDQAPLCFVGKGVCFDTGGISIKPSANMEDMKWDMGGSATVIGLMRTLAARGARVNAVGVVGLVENMPDGKAQRPGDVVKSMSGQTIEVINTDAEGRLVLADALWYAQEHFKPKLVVDLATLTGAIIVALGFVRAGLFSNDDTLAKRLFDIGKATGEDVWRMPLAESYDDLINSDIADIKNVGDGKGAGSITAAQFLKRFIKEDMPWAHLDIAGIAWANKDQATCPKGATGFGVRLLDQFVREHYEG